MYHQPVIKRLGMGVGGWGWGWRDQGLFAFASFPLPEPTQANGDMRQGDGVDFGAARTKQTAIFHNDRSCRGYHRNKAYYNSIGFPKAPVRSIGGSPA